MPSKNPQSVCLICLGKFGKVPDQVNDQSYRYRHRLLHTQSDQDGAPSGSDTDTQEAPVPPNDLYTRFLHFTTRYLSLKGTTTPIIETLKEFKDGGGEWMEILDVFCDRCKDLVSYVCDLYAELQVVRLHLDWKVSQLGEKLARMKNTSGKYRKGLETSVAGQLRIKAIENLRAFRKRLEEKCSRRGRDSFPRSLIPHGLIAEEWKYPYPETKTILVGLIVVFILASPSIASVHVKMEETDEDMTVDRKHEGRRTRSRPSRKKSLKRKASASHGDNNENSVKMELNADTVDDEEGEDDHFITFGSRDNDGDSDWSSYSHGGASSQTSNYSNGPYSDADSNGDNTDEEIPTRKKRKVTKTNIVSVHDREGGVRIKRKCLLKKSRNFKTDIIKKIKQGRVKAYYACEICRKNFCGAMATFDHLTRAHETEEKSCYCWFCPEKFTFLQTVKFHCWKKHEKGFRVFRCENSLCCEEFLELEKYEEHLKGHIMDVPGTNTTEGNVEPLRNDDDTYLRQPETSDINTMNALTSEVGFGRIKILANEDTSSRTSPPPEEPSNPMSNKSKEKTTQHGTIVHCLKCNWCFLDPNLLKIHENIHIEPKPTNQDNFYKCPKWPECPTLFGSLLSLRSHYDDVHVNTVTYKCAECGVELISKKSWIRHMNRHKRTKEPGANAKICQDCGFLARSLASLEHHMRRHNRNNMFRCIEKGCVCSFVTCEELANHVTKFHKTEKKYPCPYTNCGSSFVSRSRVTQHVHAVHSNKTFECDICGKKFKQIYALRNHKQKLHNPNGPPSYICSECGVSVVSQSSLNEHIALRHTLNSEKRLGCLHCPRRFHKESLLKKHIISCAKKLKTLTGVGNKSRSRKKQPELKVMCSICEKTFLGRTRIFEHLSSVHETSEKSHHCMFCPKNFTLLQTKVLHRFLQHGHNEIHCEELSCKETDKFKTLEELEEHLKTHILTDANTSNDTLQNQSSDQAKTLADGNAEDIGMSSKLQQIILHCSKCHWGFLDPDLLKLHEMVHEENPNNDFYQCPKCVTFHKTLKSLQLHFYDCHGKLAAPIYECQECSNKKLLSKESWLNHMQRHKESEVTCSVCGILCKGSAKLKHHMKLHDPNYGFPCPEAGCGAKKFGCKATLERHLLKVHKIGMPLPCPHEECGFVGTSHQLSSHFQNVHAKHNFICDVCGKFYRQASSLRKHKNVDHGPNPRPANICSECGMSFRTPYGLIYHTESIHTPNDEKKYGCPHCPKRYHREPLLKKHIETCAKINPVATDGQTSNDDPHMLPRKGNSEDGAIHETVESEVSTSNQLNYNAPPELPF